MYLPLSLILYFLAPLKWRNLILFVISAIFYGWEKPIYLLIMLFVIVINYISGILIDRAKKNPKRRKQILYLGVLINLLILGFFKYADFLLETLAHIPILSFIEPVDVSLPIGISFYIFQSMSYVIDVYCDTSPAQRKFANFGAYISMFPQLIAGPIVKYSDIDAELNERKCSIAESSDGVRRFIVGLAKKVLLADTAGVLWEQIEGAPRDETSVLGLWLGIILYSFQIYFDFSGYSDMAIGLGKILGFHFPENFNYPYMARSITDFWRRWHITLSSWFREYVYIPLGGNRCGVKRLVLNLLIVWLLTGLWHGASWNFVLWGLYYFVLLVLEKLFLAKLLDKLPCALSHIYALFFIVIGWLIFYFKSDLGGFEELSLYFGGMLGFSNLPFVNGELGYLLQSNFLFLAVLCIACTPYPKKIFLKIKGRLKKESNRLAFSTLFDILLILVFVLCIAYISSSEYRPNIYYEF